MDANAASPSLVPHHTIQRLSVEGGFLAGVELKFADGLNCLIGGRGTGKTTALEFLRYGLGLMPDPKLQGTRYRAIESLVSANLRSGRIVVDVRTKTGMLYTADRADSENVQVRNELGTAVPISLDRDQVFSADVFSQNEIEGIALNPSAQLELFDRFREPENARIQEELRQLHRDLEQSAAELRKLDSMIEDLGGKAAEVAGYEERLKGLADVAGPDAARINAAHDGRAVRAAEGRYPALLIEAVRRVAKDVSAVEATFQASIGGYADLTDKDRPNASVMSALRQEADAFGDTLALLSADLGARAREAELRIEEQRGALAAQHAAQEAEYRTFLAHTEAAGGRIAERQRLQESLAEAQTANRERSERMKQREGALLVRRELLRRLSELRDERFALRRQVAEQLTHEVPGLRVTVTQAADLEEYRDRLAEMLKGSGVQQNKVAEQLSETFLPAELAEIVLNRNHAALMAGVAYDANRARRVLDSLYNSGAAYALEVVDLHDRPCIELRDGGVFKESSHLSTGQRCTTILPILLIQSERPLLIDQPEDNLDNAFVYDTIVSALKAVKGSRQVIFVTHNPNIPVLGEASRVFVFNSDGERAEVRRVGTVDDCREDIERILEGGREAFAKRMARYGH